MTMVSSFRETSAGTLIVALLVWFGSAAWLSGQTPPVHYNHAGIMPPGAIGGQQLTRGGPLPGYFQPVEIKAPSGVLISTATAGEFDQPQPASLVAGMLIGAVYRLRVTNIPGHEGLEVYPTIEVIDRLYPPLGQEFRFPILIDLALEELESALEGKFVTRVVYLEEPEAALPVAQKRDEQDVFEVRDGENPLEIADTLGRPMAIVRMGGRLPDAVNGPDQTFMYGSPLMIKFRKRGPGVTPEMIVPTSPLARTSDAKVVPTSARAARKPRIVRGPVAQ